MTKVGFNRQQMDRFNDRIENCLEDGQCRKILERYLVMSDNPVLLNALRLWEAAFTANSFDEDAFLVLIETVPGFDTNQLEQYTTSEDKLDYVRIDSCGKLGKIHKHFMEYLET